MRYPIKTLSQLPLVLKGFRKVRGFTQAAMAQRLGITQQSYAHFEANLATATLERLFVVLRILGVEITLDQVDSVTSQITKTFVRTDASAKAVGKRVSAVKAVSKTTGKMARATTVMRKALQSGVSKPARIVPAVRKKENW